MLVCACSKFANLSNISEGIGHSAPFDWQEASDTEKVMQVNFLGGVYVTKTFLPLIKKAKGRIIGKRLSLPK